MTVNGLLAMLLHVPLMAGAAFALTVVGPWAVALLEGRAGPPLLQPWHEWRRLLRKRPLRPESTSPLFATAPIASLAILAVVALLVPSFTLGMATSPAADLVVIAGLLVASRVLLVLAALDAGSATGSVAAIGTLRAGMLAEPALLLGALILVLLTSSANLNSALAALRELSQPSISLVLLVCGLAAITVAAEAQADEIPACFSGWQLAAAQAGGALRRVIWLSLLAALLLPGSLASPGFDALAWVLAILVWAVKLLILGGAAALAGPIVRQALPRPGMPVMGGALLLVLLGLLFLLAGGELT